MCAAVAPQALGANASGYPSPEAVRAAAARITTVEASNEPSPVSEVATRVPSKPGATPRYFSDASPAKSGLGSSQRLSPAVGGRLIQTGLRPPPNVSPARLEALREFTAMLLAKYSDFDAAFSAFDDNGSGQIAAYEFQAAAENMKYKGDIMGIFHELDHKRQGSLSRSDFQVLLHWRPGAPEQEEVAKVNPLTVSTATELCEQIRWLREGSALVSTCDAMLAAKVERMQQVQASRRLRMADRGFGDLSSKMQTSQQWLSGNMFERTSKLLLACVLYAWAEDALRRRVVRELIRTSSTQCLFIFLFSLWRRGIGLHKLGDAHVKMQADMDAVQREAHAYLGRLQEMYAKVQLKQTEHICSTFRRALGLTFWTKATLFELWNDLTALSKANHLVKAKCAAQSRAFLNVYLVYIVSASYQGWRRIVAYRKQVEKKAGLMGKAIMVLRNVMHRDMVRLCLAGWRDITRNTRKGKADEEKRRKKVKEAALRESTITVKAMGKAIRSRYNQEAFRIFGEITGTGKLYTTFSSWKAEAERDHIAKRIRWLENQSSQMEELQTHTEAQFRIRYEWLVTVQLDARFKLVFMAWVRLSYFGELNRLNGALRRKQQLTEELEAVQLRTRRQQVLTAASSLAHTLEKGVRKVQHMALERMHYSLVQYHAADVRQDVVRQKDLLTAESRSGVEMRSQALRRQKVASKVTAQILSRQFEDRCRSIVQLWHCLAADAALIRQVEERKAGFESWRGEHEAKGKGLREKKLEMFMGPVEKLGLTLTLMRMWRSWEQAVYASQAAAEREDQRERIAYMEMELENYCDERKELVQSPLVQWVLQHLGLDGGAGPAVSPSRLKSFLREWHQVSMFASKQRRAEEQKKAIHDVIVEKAAEVGERLDDTLLMRVISLWWMLARIVQTSRDNAEAAQARSIRAAVQSRLQRFIKASTCYWERCEATDLLLRVFGAWRRQAGVTVVRHTGTQVCKELEGRTVAGRRMVLDEEERIAQVFVASSKWTQGDVFVKDLVACLVVPAWRRVARATRLRRAVLIGEEQALVELEGLQRRASARCREWAYWVAVGRVRATVRESAIEVLFVWHMEASRSGHVERKTAVKSSLLRAADRAIDNSRKMLWRAFAAWRQAERNEDILRLEEQAQELEDQLMRIAGGEGASLLLDDLSDSSSDETSSRSSHGSAWSETGSISPSSPSPSRASRASRGSRERRRRSSTPTGGTSSTDATPLVGPTSLAGRGAPAPADARPWPWNTPASDAEALTLFSGLSSSSGGPSAEAPAPDSPPTATEDLPTFAPMPGQEVQPVQADLSSPRSATMIRQESSVTGISSSLQTGTDLIGSQKTADLLGTQRTAIDPIGSQRTAADLIGSQRTAADLIGLEAATMELESSSRRGPQMPTTLELKDEAALLEAEVSQLRGSARLLVETEASQLRGSARSGIRPQKPVLELKDEAPAPPIVPQAAGSQTVPALALSAVPPAPARPPTASSAASSPPTTLNTAKTGVQQMQSAASQARLANLQATSFQPILNDRASASIAAYPQEFGQAARSSFVTTSAASVASLPAAGTAGSPTAGAIPDFAARLSQFTFGLNIGSSR